jgi:hypothetical protein
VWLVILLVAQLRGIFSFNLVEGFKMLQQNFSLAPQTMAESIEFSKMVSRSSMCPPCYKNKPEDVMIAIQWGHELGLQPLQSLQNISVINGKPNVYGDAALALVRSHPNCLGVKEWLEGEGEKLTAYCCVTRAYGDTVEKTTKSFSIADAKRARLWGRKGPWTEYPKRMLTMRARGFAIRDAFPDALKGMITREEAQDYPNEHKDNVTYIVKKEAEELATSQQVTEVKDLIKKLGVSDDLILEWLTRANVNSFDEMTSERIAKAIEYLNKKMEACENEE